MSISHEYFLRAEKWENNDKKYSDCEKLLTLISMNKVSKSWVNYENFEYSLSTENRYSNGEYRHVVCTWRCYAETVTYLLNWTVTFVAKRERIKNFKTVTIEEMRLIFRAPIRQLLILRTKNLSMQSWKEKRKILAEASLAPSGLVGSASIFLNFQLCTERFFDATTTKEYTFKPDRYRRPHPV